MPYDRELSKSEHQRRQKLHKENPLTEIEWTDSTGYDRWQDIKDAKDEKCVIIKSVGYVVKSNRNHVSIVGDIDYQDNPNVSRQLTIPRGCIRNIRRI